MNQDKIQYILIGLLMVGMFAIGVGVYVMGQQIHLISESIKTIEQGMGQQTKAPAVPSTQQTQQDASNMITIGGLTFDLPKGWSSKGVDANGDTLIHVPDLSYNVMIPVDVHLLASAESAKCLSGEYCDVVVTTPSTIVYSSGQLLPIPSLGSWIVKKGQDLYQVTFDEPVSNEPAPKDLDGVWFQSTNVTDGELLSFVLTAH